MRNNHNHLPTVTIGIINYNGMASLPDVIAAIENLDYPSFRVVVADNVSTDGSREWLQTHHPDVQCICMPANKGPAGARNAILNISLDPYVFFLDNDITVEKDTLSKLVEVIESAPRIAACHPEISDENDPYCYHYNGGGIHYLGALISRELPTEARPEYEVFDIVSGGALLVNRIAAEAVGNFDEDFFFNWEDGDFVARLTLAGYLCVNVPKATVQHIGKPRGTQKSFYMVRNRWFFILKLYDLKTILLIAPALFLFDLSQAVLLLVKGNLFAYLQGNIAVLSSFSNIQRKRREFQRIKLKQDKDWLYAGNVYVSQSVLGKSSLISKLQSLVFRLFNLYWRFVQVFLESDVQMKRHDIENNPPEFVNH